MLIQREFALAGGGLVWVLILFRDVMCVARLQLAQHRHSGRHSVLGSGDRAAQGSAHKRLQDRGSHRLPPWHNFQGSKYRTLKCIMWTQGRPAVPAGAKNIVRRTYEYCRLGERTFGSTAISALVSGNGFGTGRR